MSADRIPGKPITTDGEGHALVALPTPLPRFLSVVVRKDGFTPVTLWFPTPIREDEIPASFTHGLYPVETIAGIVRDEQGRLVAGVRVAPTIWARSDEAAYLREDFESLATAITDAEGRWHCDGVPGGSTQTASPSHSRTLIMSM